MTKEEIFELINVTVNYTKPLEYVAPLKEVVLQSSRYGLTTS